MRYKLLGKSGLRVSELCLGTMTFGEEWGWGSSKDESRKVYDAFREAGGNFIDTANVYTNGASETLLGEFMRGHRDKVVLATKYTNAAPGADPNAAGNHRKSMVLAVEASLKRLIWYVPARTPFLLPEPEAAAPSRSCRTLQTAEKRSTLTSVSCSRN